MSKESEASFFFLASVGSRYAVCSVQVLHMYRNKTAAVRKLEQLFAFGATSDFRIPYMKQRLPRHGRVSSPFFTRLYIGDVDACSLSLTNCEINFTFTHVALCFVCFSTCYMATCSCAHCFGDLTHTALWVRTTVSAGLNLEEILKNNNIYLFKTEKCKWKRIMMLVDECS